MYKSYFSTCNVFLIIFIVKFFKNLCVSEVYKKKKNKNNPVFLFTKGNKLVRFF